MGAASPGGMGGAAVAAGAGGGAADGAGGGAAAGADGGAANGGAGGGAAAAAAGGKAGAQAAGTLGGATCRVEAAGCCSGCTGPPAAPPWPLLMPWRCIAAAGCGWGGCHTCRCAAAAGGGCADGPLLLGTDVTTAAITD